MYIVRKIYGFHVIVIYIYYSDKIYTIILKLNKIIINPPPQSIKFMFTCEHHCFCLFFWSSIIFFSISVLFL